MSMSVLFGNLASAMLKRGYSKTFTRKSLNVSALCMNNYIYDNLSSIHRYIEHVVNEHRVSNCSTMKSLFIKYTYLIYYQKSELISHFYELSFFVVCSGS